MNNFPRLETNRLILECPAIKHVDDLKEYFEDEQVRTFIPMKEPDDIAESVKNLKQSINLQSHITWIVSTKESKTAIGHISLQQIDMKNKHSEISYGLNSSYWKKGFMTEALTKVFEYAFAQVNLNKIFAVTSTKNESSVQLLERLGFEKEGVLKQHLRIAESYHDAATYGLLRKNWNND
jgi:ribosomal-protein-alanine N-acetyltransferase